VQTPPPAQKQPAPLPALLVPTLTSAVKCAAVVPAEPERSNRAPVASMSEARLLLYVGWSTWPPTQRRSASLTESGGGSSGAIGAARDPRCGSAVFLSSVL